MRNLCAIIALTVLLPAGVSSASGEGAPVVSIRDLGVDADGDGASDLAGRHVTLPGRTSVAAGVLSRTSLRIYVQQGEAGVEVLSPEPPGDIPDGALVEVTGILASRDGAPVIREALVTVLRKGDPVAPAESTLARVDEGAFRGVLVRVRAEFLDSHPCEGGTVWRLLDGDTTLSCVLLHELDRIPSEPICGTSVDVTGIATVRPGADGTSDPVILVRGPADVSVVASRPLVDERNMPYVLGGLALLALTVAAWIFVLQLKLRRGTRRLSSLRDEIRLHEQSSVVGILVAGAAHEINNPLTAVIGFAELLVDDPELPERYQEQVRHIEQAANRVRDTTSSIIDLARPGSLESRPVSLEEVVESIDWARSEAGRRGIEFIPLVEPGLPHVLSHPHHLRQLFSVLISTAMESIVESGTGSTVWLRAVRGQSGVFLTVEDDGPGPDGDERRPSRMSGRTFAAEIARRHGGTLEVTPREGGGTEVFVRLCSVQEELVG
ncbi:MAG: sensor histidine kinase [Planctomycetota bacterium]